MLKVALISLGCSRNLVDSEVILGSLKRSGFDIKPPGEPVGILIINTCAFIAPSREESIAEILNAVELKKKGRIKHIVVSGCLSQLYREKIITALPMVDMVFGTSDIAMIGEALAGRIRKGAFVSRRLDYLYDENSPRFILTPRHYAYVKISEGCSNSCSYCIISRLRGKFRSRTIESVVKEAGKISASGRLKEMILIGQDTTSFGKDIYGKPKIAELLKKLDGLKPGVKWIRLLYTHPAHYDDRLIKAVRDGRNILKYLDLPIQHINDRILKAMNRRTSKKEIMRLVERLRKTIPGITLRTSIIVGFPGEGEREFRELIDFVRDAKFERLGAFAYSKEAGTGALRLKDHVPEKVKRERLDELMKIQACISKEANEGYIGKVLKVLIDEKCAGVKDLYMGRTEHDAPEVDCAVYVRGRGLKDGEFYSVKMEDALEYDLIGRVV